MCVTTENWRTARNMENAILVGPSRGTGSGPIKVVAQECPPSLGFQGWFLRDCLRWQGNLRCFRDIIVEGNSIVVKQGNGTCAKNGLEVAAEHTVSRNNTCSVGQ